MNTLWSEFMFFFNTNPPLISFALGVVAFIWGVAAFGLGTWFGHRLAKSRDRRKEFNVIADQLNSFSWLSSGDSRSGMLDIGTLALNLTVSPFTCQQKASDL